MLTTPRLSTAISDPPPTRQGPRIAAGHGVDEIGRRVRRHWLAIILAFVGTIALGAGLVAQTIPRYTASVAIMIDARKVGLTALSALEGSLAFDTGAVDSQVQLLQSDAIADGVGRRLDLHNQSAFLNEPRSLVGRVFAKLMSYIEPPIRIEDYPESIRREYVVRVLQAGLSVRRVGRTYVLSIEFTHHDPATASLVANAYANVYLTDQLESKFDAARRASAWMDERLRDIRSKAIAADDAVQRYRAENSLTFASGQLVSERALTDINTQLSSARGALADAESRYARLQKLVSERQFSGAISEELNSPVVADLRGRYVAAQKRLAELEQRLAPGHDQIANARDQVSQYEKLIFGELKRTLEAYRSDVEISRDRVHRLEREAALQVAGNADDGKALAKLNSLMQEASTYNTLYAAFLQRYQETAEQETFPVGDARIISPATTPMFPSSPNLPRAGVITVVLAGLLAAATVVLLEVRERGYRTREQIQDDLGTALIAYLPDVASGRGGRRRIFGLKAAGSPMNLTVEQPLSRFAEGIRAIQITAERNRPTGRAHVIGVVSILAGEGKSTVSKNVASHMARIGKPTLLIDADARHPTLTRFFTDHPGALDPADLGIQPAGFLAGVEPTTGLAFVGRPAADDDAAGRQGDGPSALPDIVARAGNRYGTIVVDFPPLALLHDAVEHAGLVDVFVIVVEWGMTPRRVIREILGAYPEITAKVEGIVLNKCALQSLSLYGSDASAYSYTKEAARYYKPIA